VLGLVIGGLMVSKEGFLEKVRPILEEGFWCDLDRVFLYHLRVNYKRVGTSIYRNKGLQS